VTDRLVLTAGHCVRRFARNPRTIRFKAGVHKGRAQSIRRAARIVLPLMTGSGGKSVAPDVALVQLDFPVSAEFAQPLPLADGKADRFTLIAYRRDRPQSAERNDDCRTVTASNGLIALTCPVVSGNSGAPLLQWTERGWHVAGVMVASVPAGEIRSWAVEIPPDLRAVIAASP
jgi:V8-like Glu-specific endopeptidase